MSPPTTVTLPRTPKDRKRETTVPKFGPDAPLGATLVAGGALFRTWAPCALAISVRGSFSNWKDISLQRESGSAFWSVFVDGVQAGDEYKFWVKGAGSEYWKRDPYARALSPKPDAPPESWNCVVAEADSFPWHDAGFTPPALQ
jgi:1,4-alpha-glucan branching enzyme